MAGTTVFERGVGGIDLRSNKTFLQCFSYKMFPKMQTKGEARGPASLLLESEPE